MAYDDIRISELPSLPEIHVNDLLLVQDVSNGLAHNIDWNQLKNSIGTLAKGITFPLGTVEEPQIAIGDYTSGIMAEDFGQFSIVTHGYKRIKINQAGTTEIINGNVVIGNYDRQCTYHLIVNNITTFNCDVRFQDDLVIDGNLDVIGDITAGGDLVVLGDVILGSGCDNTVTINAELIARCDLELSGSIDIDGDLHVSGNSNLDGDVNIGTSCSTTTLTVNSESFINCDLTVSGDTTLKNDVNLGTNCTDVIEINGLTNIHCDLKVDGDVSLGTDCDSSVDMYADTVVHCDFGVVGDVVLGSGCNPDKPNQIELNGNTLIDCDLNVKGDINLEGNVILGTECPDPDTGVEGNTVDILGDTTIECDLEVKGDVILGTECPDDLTGLPGNTVEINGDTTINCDFEVKGDVILGSTTDCDVDPNDISLNGNVGVTCDLEVGGSTYIEGNLIVGDPTGSCDDAPEIELNGPTVISCDFTVGQPPDPDGWVDCDDAPDIELNGPTIVNCDFTVGRPPGSNGFDCDTAPEVELNANTSINCDLTVEGDTTLNGKLEVGVNGDCDTDIILHGDTQIDCDLNVDKNVTIGGNTQIDGDLTIGLPSYDCDDVDNPSVEINGPVDIKCDLNVDGNLVVGPPPPNPEPDDFCDKAPEIELNGNTSINCNLVVDKDVDINGDLYVCGMIKGCDPDTPVVIGEGCDKGPLYINTSVYHNCDSFFRQYDGSDYINTNGAAPVTQIVADAYEKYYGSDVVAGAEQSYVQKLQAKDGTFAYIDDVLLSEALVLVGAKDGTLWDGTPGPNDRRPGATTPLVGDVYINTAGSTAAPATINSTLKSKLRNPTDLYENTNVTPPVRDKIIKGDKFIYLPDGGKDYLFMPSPSVVDLDLEITSTTNVIHNTGGTGVTLLGATSDASCNGDAGLLVPTDKCKIDNGVTTLDGGPGIHTYKDPANANRRVVSVDVVTTGNGENGLAYDISPTPSLNDTSAAKLVFNGNLKVQSGSAKNPTLTLGRTKDTGNASVQFVGNDKSIYISTPNNNTKQVDIKLIEPSSKANALYARVNNYTGGAGPAWHEITGSDLANLVSVGRGIAKDANKIIADIDTAKGLTFTGAGDARKVAFAGTLKVNNATDPTITLAATTSGNNTVKLTGSSTSIKTTGSGTNNVTIELREPGSSATALYARTNNFTGVAGPAWRQISKVDLGKILDAGSAIDSPKLDTGIVHVNINQLDDRALTTP